MNGSSATVRLATLLLAFCTATLLSLNAPAAEPQSLFDGRSLQGWKADTDYWRVESGSIVGEIAPGTRLGKNTWLVWDDKEIADFELRVQFRLTGAAGANSGIQIRCQVENVDHVSGYQADLDMGQVWLGRIYDEHGRALLVERGTRVHIAPDGKRQSQVFAPKDQFQVLFRENAWNDYRIVAVGDRFDVYVNGTLFSQLRDEEKGERDLKGGLAFQLHSGGETKIEFKNILLTELTSDDKDRLAPFSIQPPAAAAPDGDIGVLPQDASSRALNLAFESGDLRDWHATGDAFEGQPVQQDNIAARWANQVSNKQGEYFIGGFELKRDAGQGTLTSSAFSVTHPFASFLVGGGKDRRTRVEIVKVANDQDPGEVIHTASGQDTEQMSRTVVDLRSSLGSRIAVRLVDESSGGWGHLNFDDFRFHDEPPSIAEAPRAWRSTFNPVLQHLQPNPKPLAKRPAATTVEQMFVPEGFSVDLVAAEPDVHQPIAFTFDTSGRIWVAEGHSYPQKRPQGEGLDRLVILEDRDGNGSFETRNVFIEGLNLVSGFEVGHGGVWVGAAPELLFIPDKDRDDVPDGPPQVLLDGFGYADTHETLNSFLWGPDGWLYGNQGVFNSSQIGKPGAPVAERVGLSAGVWRYHPTRHVFEVFAHGGSNQWGLDYDLYGQLFMTHCRSHWGQGATTHVMRGGHYWNQVNGNYAPFISAQSLPNMPHLKNYLLASARYGHGEGGAGKPGTRQVYGGHSHVGTMIYLGDNWPREYHNHLFTLNLHGHQINHQINLRDAGGYNTVHAGSDVLFCSDQQFVGVDLKVGPDGSVYFSDWYDPRHCHNPNLELWDRGNGRIYRMRYDATFAPQSADWYSASNDALIDAQQHANDWHARAARQVLAERATENPLAPDSVARLQEWAQGHSELAIRLRSVWSLYAARALERPFIERLLNDPSEYIRGWAIQLGCDVLTEDEIGPMLAAQIKQEKSLWVARYASSALLDVDPKSGWEIARTLATWSHLAEDRDLPKLLWFGVAGLMDSGLDRGLELAEQTRLPALRDNIYWYAARSSSKGRDYVVDRLIDSPPEQQEQMLVLLRHALQGLSGLDAPRNWPRFAQQLYRSDNSNLRDAAQSVGAAFGDEALFAEIRLSAAKLNPTERLRSLELLALSRSPENVDVLLDSLQGSPRVQIAALQQLSRYGSERIPETVLSKLPTWTGNTNDSAMELLCSRPDWAHLLLNAIDAGQLPEERLTAYFANQMFNLQDSDLVKRLEAKWGRIGASSAELREEIQKTIRAFESAPKWAFSEQAGAAQFQKLCASCHAPDAENERLAPKLQGTRTKGVAYVVENVVDPNAVIGRDFLARVILTESGQVITGLVESESESALVVKTATNRVTLDKQEIEEIKISENSFMPTGLLNPLNERERIELLKYVLSL